MNTNMSSYSNGINNYNNNNKGNKIIIIHNVIINTIIFISLITFCVVTKNYFHRYCVRYYYAYYNN